MSELIALRLPSELSRRYKKLAAATNRTKTFYMSEALSKAIDQLEYEYMILQKVEKYHAGELKTVSLEELGEELGLQ